ncbi:PHP domain-containing protein [Candidatus Woesearchaeota archaeon]|nr:PHP domain-containing protein [Candidatus Woesearchaeota archaeon]
MLNVDLHIHSLMSGHAYGSFYDIVSEAQKKELKLIAITDHGPALGYTSIHNFLMGFRKPHFDNLKILWGCEANILDDGKIDLNERALNKLDLLLVGLHIDANGISNNGFEKNTENYIEVLKNYPVKIITHPYSLKLPFDFLKVVEFALDHNILPELNLSYLNDSTVENVKLMLDLVKRKGKKVIVNSDAHFLHEIGDDSKLELYSERIGLTPDLIINNNLEELYSFLGIAE